MGYWLQSLIWGTAMAAIVNMLYNLRHNFQVLRIVQEHCLIIVPKRKTWELTYIEFLRL